MSKLHKNKEYYADTKNTTDLVREEINKGLELLNRIQNPIVAFFGSHKVKKNSNYYQHCEKVAFELGKRGYAILSGGGPGIMHASNAGATQAKTISVGLTAKLLKGERIKDTIFTDKMSFHFLFVRRFIMSIKSEALIFYPGGYGTLNELFEYAVLMQTDIVDTVPIICVNREYWEGLFKWLKNNPLKEDLLISKNDINLIHFVDSIDEILNIIEK
jgi:uncharacterized protein (TIGR00730 family)